jgi:hypothetical protein
LFSSKEEVIALFIEKKKNITNKMNNLNEFVHDALHISFNRTENIIDIVKTVFSLCNRTVFFLLFFILNNLNRKLRLM